ncbi:MAG: hypothetical protein JXA90_00285 [Planctomycetes bacterium]|nr:hypothetical protein [Planctomycetota bacterium]
MPERRGILSRLPEVYRREGGETFRRYARIAEEEAEEVLSYLEQRGPQLAGILVAELRGPREAAAPRAAECVDARSAGTASAVARWLRQRGAAPRIWPALAVSSIEGERLLFARSCEPAAVLAWTRRDLAEPPERAELPEPLVPAGCRVEAVWLAEEPAVSPPLPGTVLEGRRIAVELLREGIETETITGPAES